MSFFETLLAYCQYLYILSVSDCLSVCLSPINVKTAEPIWTKFRVGHHVTPGKVYGWSKFQKFASNKIWLSLNFENLRNYFNPRFKKIYFTLYSKRECLQLKRLVSLESQNWVNRVDFQKHLTTPQTLQPIIHFLRGGEESFAIYAFNRTCCKNLGEPCIMILETNVRYWLIDWFIDWLID